MKAYKSLDAYSYFVAGCEALNIESQTRDQAKSRAWFDMRAVRITASRFKSAARTDPDNVLKSLIKSICYPQAFKFSSQATRCGCDHEAQARDADEMQARDQHSGLAVRDSGLCINPSYPYLGASPDGVVSCTCCGEGIIEIKCPFCKKDMSVTEAATDSKFCLVKSEDVLARQNAHLLLPGPVPTTGN